MLIFQCAANKNKLHVVDSMIAFSCYISKNVSCDIFDLFSLRSNATRFHFKNIFLSDSFVDALTEKELVHGL